MYWVLVEGRDSKSKAELDEQLGLDGGGRANLNDPLIPEELREALAGQAVPAWYDEKSPTSGSFASFR